MLPDVAGNVVPDAGAWADGDSILQRSMQIAIYETRAKFHEVQPAN
jgi:hypothetical protein